MITRLLSRYFRWFSLSRLSKGPLSAGSSTAPDNQDQIFATLGRMQDTRVSPGYSRAIQTFNNVSESGVRRYL